MHFPQKRPEVCCNLEYFATLTCYGQWKRFCRLRFDVFFESLKCFESAKISFHSAGFPFLLGINSRAEQGPRMRRSNFFGCLKAVYRICRNKRPGCSILRSNKKNIPKSIKTHRFCVLPPLKNHPSKAIVLCTPPFGNHHQIPSVLCTPPFEKSLFLGGRLFRVGVYLGVGVFLANTVQLNFKLLTIAYVIFGTSENDSSMCGIFHQKQKKISYDQSSYVQGEIEQADTGKIRWPF